MDTNEAEDGAKALLEQKTGKCFSYEELRKKGLTGYAAMYMNETKDVKNLTTAAELDTMMKLAQFDHALGTTIPQLIFACCLNAPKREFLESLFSLDSRSKIVSLGDELNSVIDVLSITDKDGCNCLMACFELAVQYRRETGKYPEQTTGLMADIEGCVQYLIEKGKSNNVDVNLLLNHTSRHGNTLFHLASQFSEKLAKQLLDLNVNVKTVNDSFITPSFRVSKYINYDF